MTRLEPIWDLAGSHYLSLGERDDRDCSKVVFALPDGRRALIRFSEGGLLPKAWLSGDGLLVVSADQEVYQVSSTGHVIETKLGGHVFDVLEFDDCLIVVHEIGAAGIIPGDAAPLWNVPTDILADWSIENSVLSLVELEGGKTTRRDLKARQR